MFYNKWEFRQELDGVLLLTFTEDTMDRKSKRKYLPIGGPGFAFIWYPRKDDEQDRKYKEILLHYIRDQLISQLEQNMCLLSELSIPFKPYFGSSHSCYGGKITNKIIERKLRKAEHAT